jgi:hypothetical protein
MADETLIKALQIWAEFVPPMFPEETESTSQQTEDRA